MAEFIEISGAMLLKMADSHELPDLRAAGVKDESKMRVNRHGDIEMLHGHTWNIIGGLLGDYQSRIRKLTGQDWTTSQ